MRFAICVIAVSMCALVPTDASGALPPYLTGWWKFDDSLNDTVAPGRQEDAVGGPLSYTARADRPSLGSALDLNGVDQRVSIWNRYAGDLIQTNTTVSYWVYARQSRWQDILSMGTVGTIQFLDNGAQRINHFVKAAGGRNPGGVQVYLSTNAWQMITLTYDGTTIKVSRNGNPAETWSTLVHPTPGDIPADTWVLGVGGNSGGGGWFDGMIDDLRIYNRALTDAEIAGLYAAAAPAISTVVASDPDNTDNLVNIGDVITVTFDTVTNKGYGGIGDNQTYSGSELDALLLPGGGHSFGGASDSFEVVWTDATTLVITALALTPSCTVAPGDTLTVTAGADIRNAAYSSGASLATSPAMTGDWGTQLPIVTLTASDADGHEQGTDTGEFTLTRDYVGYPATGGDLTVSYEVDAASTASGSDYGPALTGTVVIPDGDSSVTILITPVDDAEGDEPDETVVLNILPDAAYETAPTTTATVTIKDNDHRPAGFALVAPADDAHGIPLIPGFDWEDSVIVTATVDYELVVATDAAMTSAVFTTTTTDVSEFALTPSDILTPDTVYYWRVTATDVNGPTVASNAPFSFTTASGSDTDWDGDGLLNDDETTTYLTDPMDADSDGDGMPDGWEILHGFDPLTSDGGGDPDDDLFSNLEEYRNGSDPHFNDLPGLGATLPGCVASEAPGSSSVLPLALTFAAVLILITARPRRGRRRDTALAWVMLGVVALSALSGCGGATYAKALETSTRPLSPLPVAAYIDTTPSEFPSGWSQRGGVVVFPSADMAARLNLGAYYHTLENDDRRVEMSILVAPDFANFAQSEYFTLAGDYLGFLGDSGDFYWRAGGGAIVEVRGSSAMLYSLIQAGGGYWTRLPNKSVIYLNGTFQVPFGRDAEPGPTILSIDVGMDF